MDGQIVQINYTEEFIVLKETRPREWTHAFIRYI